MAAGKTSVGRRVAARLGRRFVDLDEHVEAASGKTVREIFRDQGEASFRWREAAALAEMARERDVVVATGGGTPMFGNNLARMREAGPVFSLLVSFDEVLRRVAPGESSRPLLADRAVAERIYAERERVYRSADVCLDTGGRDADAVAEDIVRRARLRLGDVNVILGERSYPIHLAGLERTADLVAELLPETRSFAVITDENVARAGHARAVRAALEGPGPGARVLEVVLPAGETAKTLAEVERAAGACVRGGLDRKSAIVAVGGGVVGDVAGFVASCLYRGVACAQVPTTLLAMVDSAIGGKTGVDLSEGKNLVGAFWQPRFVLADVRTLATLPARELRAAFGEVVKYGLLDDPELFASLERAAPTVPPSRAHERPEVASGSRRGEGFSCPEPADAGEGPPPPGVGGHIPYGSDSAALADLVLRCARQKARAVIADEREVTGTRALLNLGHTVGHAIEAAALGSAHPLLHGEAIALGLVAALEVSHRLGLCPAALRDRTAALLSRLGLDSDVRPWLRPDVLAYLAVDKKRAAGKLRFIALEDIGRPRVVELEVDELHRLLLGADPGTAR
jgi:shikimate kinase / 3-dehydroquinate synthase